MRVANWRFKEFRPFTPEEVASVERAEVIASDYGSSVCFYLVRGGMVFIPLSINSCIGLGESVDLNKAGVMVFEREGCGEVYKVCESSCV